MTNLVSKEGTNDNYVWRLNIDSIQEFQKQGHKEFRSAYDGPVCVKCGERSEYVNQNDRASFLQVFPKLDINKDIHFVAVAGHWVQVEKPREFIKLTSQYLSQF
ncbi:unnamed protein product (macronuclear) [Paramecium tetraurelia]|uniref:AB hydrolase-1 domain-containing protein n=1 Tax=Paramecium tetraurelia TaxID=5888 RepID=A0BWL6_PARTE|nr:uncharacterized protein GSPATT00032785001 [Paramecium tetraurelia]CAK62933.1 unnamed protein product [Paramecium tetraurelia]|eukprot:XP_001430331.1 hypothetical protein (macronuclear) [Paramecium tetraurelia strain d4-2]